MPDVGELSPPDIAEQLEFDLPLQNSTISKPIKMETPPIGASATLPWQVEDCRRLSLGKLSAAFNPPGGTTLPGFTAPASPPPETLFQMALDKVMASSSGSPQLLIPKAPETAAEDRAAKLTDFENVTVPAAADCTAVGEARQVTPSAIAAATPVIQSGLRGRRRRSPSARARAAAESAAVKGGGPSSSRSTSKTSGAAARNSPRIKTESKTVAAKRSAKRTPTAAELNHVSAAAVAAGVLPADHKPARGRGRQVQLQKMTKAQIEAEAEARLERNRQAARDCRLRRKIHIQGVEARCAELERENAEANRVIEELRARVRELEQQVAY